MPLTVYDQRISNAEPIDFGERQTLIKDSKKWHTFDSEKQLIKPSHYYVPVDPSSIVNVKHLYSTKVDSMLDIIEKVEQLHEKNDTVVNNVHSDPYRGNSLAIGYIKNIGYMISPGGESLCHIAINQLSKQTINIQTQQKRWQPASDIPTGSIVNCEYFNVESPILQIQVSNARNVPNDSMIIGVRTLFTCILIRVKQNNDGTLNFITLHQYSTIENFQLSDRFNKLSMCLSPYNSNQYVLLGDNDALLFFDILKINSENLDGIVHKLDLNISEENGSLDKIWKSCVFGPHPYSIIIASKNKVELIDIKTTIEGSRKTLFLCNNDDQIYGCGNLQLKHSFQFSISTNQHLHLLDVRYPNQPIISWKHHTANDPPTFIEMYNDEVDPDIVNIFGWSIETNAAIQVQYKFNGRLEYCEYDDKVPYVKPAVYSTPHFFHFHQQTEKSLDKNYTIPTIGMYFYQDILESDSSPQSLDDQVLLIFKLLNDGSIILHGFFKLDKSINKKHIVNQSIQPLEKEEEEDCDDKSSNHDNLEHIIETVENMKLEEKQHYHAKWNSKPFFRYILDHCYIFKNDDYSNNNNNNIDIIDLSRVAQNKAGNMYNLLDIELNDLKHLDHITLDDINYYIKEQNFFQPRPLLLQQSKSLFPAPNHINSFDLSLESAKKSITNYQLGFNETQEKKREKHINMFARDMYCSLMYYLPVPQPSNENKEQFQYLQFDESLCLKKKKEEKWKCKPTPSTRMLAQEWIPGRLMNLQPPNLIDPINYQQNQNLFYTHKREGQQQQQSSSTPYPSNTRRHSTKDTYTPSSNPFFTSSLDDSSFANYMNDSDMNKQIPPPVATIKIEAIERQKQHKQPISHMDMATQPEPGAFGNRIKANVAKKKKKKTLGFK